MRKLCPKCNRLDDLWDEVQRPQSSVRLNTLKKNQCVGAGVNGKGHTLYTHQCYAKPEAA